MLNEGDEFTVEMRGIQIAEDRKVQGGLIPEDSGYYWLFTNKGVKTELMLTQEAMDAMISIYAMLLGHQIKIAEGE